MNQTVKTNKSVRQKKRQRKTGGVSRIEVPEEETSNRIEEHRRNTKL